MVDHRLNPLENPAPLVLPVGILLPIPAVVLAISVEMVVAMLLVILVIPVAILLQTPVVVLAMSVVILVPILLLIPLVIPVAILLQVNLARARARLPARPRPHHQLTMVDHRLNPCENPAPLVLPILLQIPAIVLAISVVMPVVIAVGIFLPIHTVVILLLVNSVVILVAMLLGIPEGLASHCHCHLVLGIDDLAPVMFVPNVVVLLIAYDQMTCLCHWTLNKASAHVTGECRPL
jgi:hypothetical protein